MVLSFDETGDLLDKLAERFPPELFRELNGGIALLPEEKLSPEDRAGNLYTMGKYCINQMGRYIVLYYGSFVRALAGCSREEWERELYDTLSHELTHHIESLAGERSLEQKDQQNLEAYRTNQDRE
ncbi:MAG: metallopeptidase family protein [Intestinimonas sp.]|nr:metallopeptidase family protein [Intestinimonas sp.]